MSSADDVASGWAAHTLQEKARPAPPAGARPYVYASAWRACLRCMALDLLHPEDREEAGPDSLERFYRGEEIERSIVARLSLAGRLGGWTVEGTQRRYEIRGRGGRVAIVGKTDGVIVFGDGRRVPFDVKSGAAVQAVNSFEDLQAGRWTRHMPFQILAYMYGEAVEEGLLVLDQPPGPVFLGFKLSDHLEAVERFLSDAERAIACLPEPDGDGSELPPFTELISECRRCDHFGKSCAPPIDYGEGLNMITDPTLVEAARVVTENREAKRQYDRAWKTLTSNLKGCELGSLDGLFDVGGRWSKSSRTVYPSSCPSCGAAIEGTKEIDERGRFLLTVEPAGCDEP